MKIVVTKEKDWAARIVTELNIPNANMMDGANQANIPCRGLRNNLAPQLRRSAQLLPTNNTSANNGAKKV